MSNKAFIQTSDAVHAVAVKDNQTRVTVCKEWIGLHGLKVFTQAEWDEITKELRAKGFIELEIYSEAKK